MPVAVLGKSRSHAIVYYVVALFQPPANPEDQFKGARGSPGPGAER
jgi:hypothetical protein